jgi:type VI secretion system protein ImpL
MNEHLMTGLSCRPRRARRAARPRRLRGSGRAGVPLQGSPDIAEQTRFGQTEGGLFGRWLKRYIYQLPWYLIIGSPGSGKTTALINSGLASRWPPSSATRHPRRRRHAQLRLVVHRPAVLIDTAGRYTTQDSDAGADKAAWKGFMQLLRRFRGRQPVNGVSSRSACRSCSAAAIPSVPSWPS